MIAPGSVSGFDGVCKMYCAALLAAHCTVLVRVGARCMSE